MQRLKKIGVTLAAAGPDRVKASLRDTSIRMPISEDKEAAGCSKQTYTA